MPIFEFDVTWQQYRKVRVKASTAKDAVNWAYTKMGIPPDGHYIDASLQVHEDDEFVELTPEEADCQSIYDSEAEDPRNAAFFYRCGEKGKKDEPETKTEDGN